MSAPIYPQQHGGQTGATFAERLVDEALKDGEGRTPADYANVAIAYLERAGLDHAANVVFASAARVFDEDRNGFFVMRAEDF